MTKVFLILIGSLALVASDLEEDPEARLLGDYLIVKTSSGPVQGALGRSCRSGKEFGAFRGIPYAEPPIAELRFRDPVPLEKWDGVWNGTYQRSACVQPDTEFSSRADNSEDCLYLNVYTPNLKYLKSGVGPSKAVMVFIHPGGFTAGDSGERTFSPDFLVDQDVVLVTFNYRLGALGFLSFQDDDVPGNAGLKDQNLVLRWVNQNIKKFGGDPSKITIFGESAGAASVNFHLLSKSSAGLFKYAIMQSGVAITSWAYAPSDLAERKSMRLARVLKCNRNKPADTLRCLQRVPAEDIVRLQTKAVTLQEYLTMRLVAFQPTTEPDYPGAFLAEHPFDVLQSGNFSKVPTIIGLNMDEGYFLIPHVNASDPYGLLLGALSMDLSRFVPYNFNVRPLSKPAALAHREISKFYFNNKPLTKARLVDAVDLITDTMFTLPIQLTASMLAERKVPVYNYLFSYSGGYNLMKALLKEMNTNGVFHGDDLGYLFYVPQLHQMCGNVTSRSQDEIVLSRMTKLWTTFAKTGNPNPAKEKTKWEKFTQDKRNYLNIGNDLVPSDSLKLANVVFWENLLTQMVEMVNPSARNLGSSIWKVLL